MTEECRYLTFVILDLDPHVKAGIVLGKQDKIIVIVVNILKILILWDFVPIERQ